jgi:hypothetical protein
MSNDLSSIGLYLTPLILAGITLNQLKKALIIVFIISILFFLYSSQFLSLSMIGQDRSEIYKDALEFTMSSLNPVNIWQPFSVGYLNFFLLLLPLVSKNMSKKLFFFLFISSFLSIIFYTIYFQKRQNLVELTLILLFYSTLCKDLLPFLFTKKKLFSIVILIAVTFSLSSISIFDPVINRFSDTLNNVSEFDRLEEANNILSDFNPINIIIGKGFGWNSEKAVSTGSTVHIGYINLLMKGGLILIGFYFWQCYKNIKHCYNMSKIYREYNVGICISIFSIILLFISPGHGWYFISIITGLAMFSRFFITSLIKETLKVNNKILFY